MAMRNPAAQGKPDANHAEIADMYRSLHCSVFETNRVGFGYPDLTVGIGGVTCLVEVKDGEGKLRASQLTFIRDWRGSKVEVVRTPDDVIAHVTRIRARYAQGVL